MPYGLIKYLLGTSGDVIDWLASSEIDSLVLALYKLYYRSKYIIKRVNVGTSVVWCRELKILFAEVRRETNIFTGNIMMRN